jgi:hypothetical protein
MLSDAEREKQFVIPRGMPQKLRPIPSGWVGKEWALLQFGLTAMVQRLKGITRFHGI